MEINHGDYFCYKDQIWEIIDINTLDYAVLVQNTRNLERRIFDCIIFERGYAFKVEDKYMDPESAKALYGG